MFAESRDDFLFGGEEKEAFAEDFLAVQQDGEFAAFADDGFGGKAEFLLDGGRRPGSQVAVTASAVAVADRNRVHAGIVTEESDGGNKGGTTVTYGQNWYHWDCVPPPGVLWPRRNSGRSHRHR